MNNLVAVLNIEILSEWHLGSGREGGAYADSLVNKTAEGLPVINGKSIKGLLRSACEESLELNWQPGLVAEDIVNLFGQEGRGLEEQGFIKVSSATLSQGEKNYFKQNPSAIAHLYQVKFNTSIDSETGTAKETSLRSTEVVVPMTLQAEIRINSEESEKYFDWIKVSLPLIQSVGAKRRRGFGEAIFSISKGEQ